MMPTSKQIWKGWENLPNLFEHLEQLNEPYAKKLIAAINLYIEFTDSSEKTRGFPQES